MNAYLSKCAAVIDLHERGFTEDFELFGDNLLWIQEKIFLRPKDFCIVECHHFMGAQKKELVLFGIAVNGLSAKGILLNHYTSYTNKTPAVIFKKLKTLAQEIPVQDDSYTTMIFGQ